MKDIHVVGGEVREGWVNSVDQHPLVLPSAQEGDHTSRHRVIRDIYFNKSNSKSGFFVSSCSGS